MEAPTTTKAAGRRKHDASKMEHPRNKKLKVDVTYKLQLEEARDIELGRLQRGEVIPCAVDDCNNIVSLQVHCKNQFYGRRLLCDDHACTAKGTCMDFDEDRSHNVRVQARAANIRDNLEALTAAAVALSHKDNFEDFKH